MQSLEKLQDVGLTKQEAKTYLELVKLGETKTGTLCEHTGIASSNIYHVLERLIDKGLASYRLQNNTKIYMPAPPHALNELIEKKREQLERERKELQEVISELEEEQEQDLSVTDYKYYENVWGVRSMWNEINEMQSPEHMIKIHTSQQAAYEKLVDFFDKHFEVRRERGVKGRMIFPEEDPELAEQRADDVTDIRFLPLENNAEWGVFGDTLFMHHITGDTPHSFLIKDDEFADTFEQVFDELWERADDTA